MPSRKGSSFPAGDAGTAGIRGEGGSSSITPRTTWRPSPTFLAIFRVPKWRAWSSLIFSTSSGVAWLRLRFRRRRGGGGVSAGGGGFFSVSSMGIFLELGGPKARGLRFERTGGDDDLVQDAQVLRFEAAALCGSESLVRELESREVIQGLAHAGELFCKPDGQRAACGRGARLRAHDGDRVLEQTPPLAVVLCALAGGP